MHLDLMRDTATSFPVVKNPEEVRTLRVWHCKYKSLQALASFGNLEELVLATFPDPSLDILVSLQKLRFLSVLHLPKVTELEALAGLENIETLSLSTSPAWDAAKKCTVINSLEPIARMKSLRHLELFGICPADKSLASLGQCTNIKSARFSQYPKNEVESFYRTTGAANQFNPKPSFET